MGHGGSGGAFVRLEQRRDKISLGANRVTPAACWANKEKERLEQKQEASEREMTATVPAREGGV